MAGNLIELTDATFETEVLKSDLPTLVDFWAPWCGPCMTLAPTIEELANETVGKVKVCKINVDDCPDTAAKYGIRGIPTLIVFKGGDVANQITGVYPKQHIMSVIEGA